MGINGDGSSPESNTMLDIKSTGNTSAIYGLKVKDSGANDQFVVRSDGNVGLGTGAPEVELDIMAQSGNHGEIRINSGNAVPVISMRDLATNPQEWVFHVNNGPNLFQSTGDSGNKLF